MPDEINKEEPIESPYAPEVNPEASVPIAEPVANGIPTFDYDKYQDETTIKAIKEIYTILGNNIDLLAFNHDTSQDIIKEAYSKVSQDIMNIIIDCNVPDADMQKLSDSISSTIFTIFEIISRQKREFEKELLARTIAIRNPGNQRYSREYASLGDLFKALIAKRTEQGNNADDYFFVEKKEATPEEPVV